MILQRKSHRRAYLKCFFIFALALTALPTYAQQKNATVSRIGINDSGGRQKTDSNSFMIIKRYANPDSVKVYHNGNPADSNVVVISYGATGIRVIKNEEALDFSRLEIFSTENNPLNISTSSNFNMDDIRVVLIDGELRPVDDLYKINPKDIKSMGLSKGDYSNLYGKEAKKGILRITTK